MRISKLKSSKCEQSFQILVITKLKSTLQPPLVLFLTKKPHRFQTSDSSSLQNVQNLYRQSKNFSLFKQNPLNIKNPINLTQNYPKNCYNLETSFSHRHFPSQKKATMNLKIKLFPFIQVPNDFDSFGETWGSKKNT